eukprot:UN05325
MNINIFDGRVVCLFACWMEESDFSQLKFDGDVGCYMKDNKS